MMTEDITQLRTGDQLYEQYAPGDCEDFANHAISITKSIIHFMGCISTDRQMIADELDRDERFKHQTKEWKESFISAMESLCSQVWSCLCL